MSRRSRAQRKLADPDPIYNSRLVTLLVSRILQSGKKSLAQKIVYNALEIISTKTSDLKEVVLNLFDSTITETEEDTIKLYGNIDSVSGAETSLRSVVEIKDKTNFNELMRILKKSENLLLIS